MVAFEQLPVQPGLVEVALQIGGAGELHEVAVTLGGLGQQGQVVVELVAALDVAPRVVDAAPAGRALEAALGRLVRLQPQDRVQPVGPRLPVEVEDAVHVPVVGDADGGLPVLGGGLDDLVDPGRPVEHRKLGVEVQVGYGVAAAARTSH